MALVISAYFINLFTSISSLAKATISFTEERVSSTIPPSFLSEVVFSIKAFLILLEKIPRMIIINGKKARATSAKSGPMIKAMIIPVRMEAIAKIKWPIFSPIEFYIIWKYSPIWEGNCSMFYFSKNAISCSSNLCKNLLLRSKVMFSATCCQKA